MYWPRLREVSWATEEARREGRREDSHGQSDVVREEEEVVEVMMVPPSCRQNWTRELAQD